PRGRPRRQGRGRRPLRAGRRAGHPPHGEAAMRNPWRATVLGSQVAELLRRPGRFAATGLSLLIAAFVVFGTVMAQQIITATVVETFRGTPEAVSLVVEP